MWVAGIEPSVSEFLKTHLDTPLSTFHMNIYNFVCIATYISYAYVSYRIIFYINKHFDIHVKANIHANI